MNNKLIITIIKYLKKTCYVLLLHSTPNDLTLNVSLSKEENFITATENCKDILDCVCRVAF